MTNPSGSAVSPVAAASAAVAHDPMFEASDRLKRLLIYLGDKGQGCDARISQTDIAMQVMGLGRDFDPQVDAHVRIEVGRLRRALELYYARRGGQDRRVVIPKGSYRPELTPEIYPTRPPDTTPDLGAADAVIVFAGIATGPDAPPEGGDLAEIIAAELRVHCFASPLISAGLMCAPIQANVPWERCTELARKAGAPLAFSVRLHFGDAQYRVFMELYNVGTGDVLASQRQIIDATLPKPEIVRRIARAIACNLTDPMLGTVPKFAGAFSRSDGLKSVLAAFRFRATQNLETAPATLAGLEKLLASSGATGPIKGLVADMTRITGLLQNAQGAAGAHLYLEMAEDAMADDPRDITCQMALGYARLNAGLVEAALESGRRILDSIAPISLKYDARALVALADTERQCHDLLEEDPMDEEVFFYMKELSRVIPKIRWGDIEDAERTMSGSLHSNIYWLHVFHAAVLVEAGDPARARRVAERVLRQVPNLESTLPTLCRAFFPKENEHTYLLEGLRAAGLSVR